MKLTIACLSVAFIFGIGTIARAAAEEEDSCCKHCCRDKSGQACYEGK
jgi:hypothetical protein